MMNISALFWRSVFGFCLLATSAWADPIRLATHDQPPYITKQADGALSGVAVRVMSCVLKRMKQDFVIEIYPWERAQLLAETGELAGFFPATIKAERLVWASATGIIADRKWIWLLRPESKLDPLSPDFKARAEVGAHFGSNRLKMLQAANYRVVLDSPTDEMLLRAFAFGRGDAILVGDLAIADAMVKLNIDPKRFRTVVERDNPLHAYFGKKFLAANPGFIQRFDAQISACR